MRISRKVLLGLAILAVAGLVLALIFEPEYVYMPPLVDVLDPQNRRPKPAYDIWGKTVSHDEAKALQATKKGREQLKPENGAVPIDARFVHFGREQFYKETFQNEIFLTGVAGVAKGDIGLMPFVKAILALRGRGTGNLEIRIPRRTTIGGRVFEAGEVVRTGLDVPRGSWSVLGVKIKFSRWGIRLGVTCALCHAAVDPKTGNVVEGAPNLDLNTGFLLAAASNSAAYWVHTGVRSPDEFVRKPERTFETSRGKTLALPDISAFETAVDQYFLSWPPGTFDSTMDRRANPTEIPDTFTFADYPYGWSGFAIAGPFHGLSVISNNVHALNSDALSMAALSGPVFGVDPELYIAVAFQNAFDRQFRYRPQEGIAPVEFFSRVTRGRRIAGLSELVKLPTYPYASLLSTAGLMASSPGFPFMYQINAISAYQNVLLPPRVDTVDEALLQRGRQVFEKAGCARCHSGPAYTNNRILPVSQTRTQPSRAAAFKDFGKVLVAAKSYSLETPVPLPQKPKVISVPTRQFDAQQLRLALALGDSPGGYKVKGLIGLRWSPPYLHDGGVAVGPDVKRDLGIPGTFLRGKNPDAANSLLALVDKDLRSRVIKANRSSPELRKVNIEGGGHEYWVADRKDREALVQYLLSLTE